MEDEYNDFQDDMIEIRSADYLGNFVIRIHFKDGTKRVVDFKPFLESSTRQSIRKYLDENKFKQFKIIEGNLNWSDYDLIFPIADLHSGKL